MFPGGWIYAWVDIWAGRAFRPFVVTKIDYFFFHRTQQLCMMSEFITGLLQYCRLPWLAEALHYLIPAQQEHGDGSFQVLWSVLPVTVLGLERETCFFCELMRVVLRNVGLFLTILSAICV